ncbi:hypothetical protein [Pendulispora albinea]|uniref:Lipoprotein n=1 Tax=Pendulispora albinea TaxID=2741071 RepID=A0ABZ2M951_9BACT
MISIRNASLIAALGLGLMGCVSEGRAQPQTSASANADPSSVYQPSPNYRPLAVRPPVAVTGEPGPSVDPTCNSAGAAITSPNLRACP